MAQKVSRLAEVRWKRMRSEHARTLQELERARAMHPSGGAQTKATLTEAQPSLRNVTLVRVDPDSAA
jgi:hypothetical protein